MPKLGINQIVLLHAGQSDVDMCILSGMEPACEVDPCPWVRSKLSSVSFVGFKKTKSVHEGNVFPPRSRKLRIPMITHARAGAALGCSLDIDRARILCARSKSR